MQLYALQTQNDEAETWKDLVCVSSDLSRSSSSLFRHCLTMTSNRTGQTRFRSRSPSFKFLVITQPTDQSINHVVVVVVLLTLSFPRSFCFLNTNFQISIPSHSLLSHSNPVFSIAFPTFLCGTRSTTNPQSSRASARAASMSAGSRRSRQM